MQGKVSPETVTYVLRREMIPMKKFGDFSKNERVIAVVCVVWLIVSFFFVFSSNFHYVPIPEVKSQSSGSGSLAGLLEDIRREDEEKGSAKKPQPPTHQSSFDVSKFALGFFVFGLLPVVVVIGLKWSELSSIISIVWLIINLFVISVNSDLEAREVAMLFLLTGLLPVVVIIGVKWIRLSAKDIE